jgi:hypothetical protein
MSETWLAGWLALMKGAKIVKEQYITVASDFAAAEAGQGQVRFVREMLTLLPTTKHQQH